MRRNQLTVAVGALACATAVAAAGSPAVAASSAEPALAVGAGDQPAASWRLEGDRLTVRFKRPLVRDGRPLHVTVRCGDIPVPGGDLGGDGWLALVDPASRRLRVRAGVRVIRGRLDRDVARSTTWCGLDWERGRATYGFTYAPMRLRRGTPPGCRRGRGERVVLRSEHVLVTRLWKPDVVTAYRGCVRPDGRMRPLAASYNGGGGGGASLILQPFAIGGTWVAWGAQLSPHDGSWGWLAMRARDLAGGRMQKFAAAPDGAPPSSSVESVAVAPDGTVAWALRVYRQDDQLNVRLLDGSVTTVAKGAADSMTDLAIAPDGATVTWREGGVPRSAPMP